MMCQDFYEHKHFISKNKILRANIDTVTFILWYNKYIAISQIWGASIGVVVSPLKPPGYAPEYLFIIRVINGEMYIVIVHTRIYTYTV